MLLRARTHAHNKDRAQINNLTTLASRPSLPGQLWFRLLLLISLLLLMMMVVWMLVVLMTVVMLRMIAILLSAAGVPGLVGMQGSAPSSGGSSSATSSVAAATGGRPRQRSISHALGLQEGLPCAAPLLLPAHQQYLQDQVRRYERRWPRVPCAGLCTVHACEGPSLWPACLPALWPAAACFRGARQLRLHSLFWRRAGTTSCQLVCV